MKLSLVPRPSHCPVFDHFQYAYCMQEIEKMDSGKASDQKLDGGKAWEQGIWLWHKTTETCKHCQLLCIRIYTYFGKWTRPSPSVFAYCKQSKTGRWKGLGMRLYLLHLVLHIHVSVLTLRKVYCHKCSRSPVHYSCS